MVELHILQRRRGSDTLTVEREQLDRLLTLEGAARWRALASAWLALPAVSDLRLLGDVLELRVSAMHVQWYGLELLDERGFRGMFSRLIGHLASEPRWHSASDLAGLCEMIAPDALQRMQETVPTWWFTPRGRPHEPLMANAPEGRRHIYSAILDALLRGPLRWLQMVDLIESDAELLFRPRPRAAILADREPDVSAEDTGTASLSIEADEDGTPVLTLSFSGGDEMALYLSVVSEPLRPSAQGMRYSVSGLALQRMFADGLQGPMLIAWLERSSRNGVPESVRDRIERAWKSYGRVRLYDDLTLVELGDDFLLRELEALTDLPDATIHVFSPRLLAIDPERVQSVVAALTKAGYRPRLLEGA
jgi:hypothetical protein